MPTSVDLELITPAQAEVWLGHNVHNRGVNDTIVRRYAKAIANEDWPVTGDAIKFAKDGTLIDGQHRLLAIIRAGRAVKMYVARGLELEHQEYLDIGRKRSFADMLKLRGEKNSSSLAGAIAWLARIRSGNPQSNVVLSPQEGFALLDVNPGIRDVASMAYQVSIAHRLVTPALAWALSYEFICIDEDDALVFWERLATGTGLEEDDPILRLREWLIAHRVEARTGRGLATWLQAAIIIKAWNAYRDGQSLKFLRFRQGGAHPEDFPRPR
jgi:hypothetical protein